MKIQLVLLVTCAAALKLHKGGGGLEPVPDVVLDSDDGEHNPAWLHRGAGVFPNSVLSQFDSQVSYGQDCPDQKNVKLAVCVAGASRDFVHPEMTAGFNKFLMEAAIGAGATGLTRSKPDVFVHMHLGAQSDADDCKPECSLAKTREESTHDKVNTMESALAAIKDVDATNFQVEEGNGPVFNRSKLGDPSCFEHHPGHKPIEGAMAYYHNIYQCKQLLVEAEKKTGKKYDAVVLARPDYPWEFGGNGNVPNKIQCSKSVFCRDLASFQTRAAFEVYSDIWVDQMVSKEYAHCHQFFNSYEAIAEEGVTQVRAKAGPALWAGKWYNNFLSAPQLVPDKSNSLFCVAFILNTGGNFKLLEQQFKKCDDYAFLSTFDDEEKKIRKVLDVAPPKSHRNYPIAEPMWAYLLQFADKYNWFVKVDTDTFLRPSMMRQSLAQWDAKDTIAVGRPGRNGHIALVGAAMALSGPMVKQLQTKHLDPQELASGKWHGEDTVLNAWVPAAGGTIKNALNADNGCTTFSTCDVQDLPTNEDVSTMKAGQSYTKKGTFHVEYAEFQNTDICYSSNLAAIHPVKEYARYAELLKEFE